MATTKIRKSSYSEQIIFYEKLLDKLDNKIKDIYVSKKIFNKRLKKVKKLFAKHGNILPKNNLKLK